MIRNIRLDRLSELVPAVERELREGLPLVGVKNDDDTIEEWLNFSEGSTPKYTCRAPTTENATAFVAWRNIGHKWP